MHSPKLRLVLASFVFAPLALAAPVQLPRTALPVGPLDSGGAWKFNPGAEFPGAKGNFSAYDSGWTGVLKFDFTDGGNYVAAISEINLPSGYSELRFKVRAERKLKVGVRFRDDTQQFHQVDIMYEKPGEWQILRIDLFSFPGRLHWGGANDGKLAFPLNRMIVMATNPHDAPLAGELEFTDIQALP